MRHGIGNRICAALALAAIGLANAGCASATGYKPAATPMEAGYTEQRIEDNRYLITVRGNFVTARDRVEQLALYRAADLTVQKGFDYFIIQKRSADRIARLDPFGGSAFAGSAFGGSWYSPRWGWRWWDDPIWADPPSYREVSRFEATAEIAMFKGSKPEGDADAYDARSVMANLASVVATTR